MIRCVLGWLRQLQSFSCPIMWLCWTSPPALPSCKLLSRICCLLKMILTITNLLMNLTLLSQGPFLSLLFFSWICLLSANIQIGKLTSKNGRRTHKLGIKFSSSPTSCTRRRRPSFWIIDSSWGLFVHGVALRPTLCFFLIWFLWCHRIAPSPLGFLGSLFRLGLWLGSCHL